MRSGSSPKPWREGRGALARTDVAQQGFQRLEADRVRRDQLVARVNLKPGVHEMNQGRCVGHVASHGLGLMSQAGTAGLDLKCFKFPILTVWTRTG
jgi:hypothetical protein